MRHLPRLVSQARFQIRFPGKSRPDRAPHAAGRGRPAAAQHLQVPSLEGFLLIKLSRPAGKPASSESPSSRWSVAATASADLGPPERLRAPRAPKATTRGARSRCCGPLRRRRRVALGSPRRQARGTSANVAPGAGKMPASEVAGCEAHRWSDA